MGFEDFHRLFNKCLAMVDRVPPDQRDALLEIAEAFLKLANDCIKQREAAQNARITGMTQ